MKRFVLVAGSIGAGKTSLTKGIGQRLGWQTGYESVSDNPYLSDFYGDMAAWGFHLQVFFLGHRAQQHTQLAESPESAISDRSIYEDAEIFARVLRHLGNMNERDYQAYRSVYELVIPSLPKPDLLLHLTTPIETLHQRIQKRGRKMEMGITTDYLALLDTFYEEWMATFDDCPVLTIHTENLDFVNKPQHLDIVAQHIQDKLAGREDITFVD